MGNTGKTTSCEHSSLGDLISSSRIEGIQYTRFLVWNLKHRRVQGGPLPVVSRRYNSIYRGYNPSYPFIRPLIRSRTPFITSRGPPCRSFLRRYEIVHIRKGLPFQKIFFGGKLERPFTAGWSPQMVVIVRGIVPLKITRIFCNLPSLWIPTTISIPLLKSSSVFFDHGDFPPEKLLGVFFRYQIGDDLRNLFI